MMPIERDVELVAALREAAGDDPDAVDWVRLERTIARRAAPALARRRLRYRGKRLAIPAALAASLAVLLLSSSREGPSPAVGSRPVQTATAGGMTVDDLLDAELSDAQFRAVLFGAGEAEDLLLIAAETRP